MDFVENPINEGLELEAIPSGDDKERVVKLNALVRKLQKKGKEDEETIAMLNRKLQNKLNGQRNELSDWATHKDEDSGHTYYVNNKTRRSTWTRPEDMNKDEHTTGRNAGNHDRRSRLHLKGKKKKKEKKITGEWTEHVDQESGASYYSSNRTRRSTWSKPYDFEE